MYIQISIDKSLERLEYGIDKFRQGYKFYPYIVCSEETLEYIKYYCLAENQEKLYYSHDPHDPRSEFRGCKVIIDNIYKLGEIYLI